MATNNLDLSKADALYEELGRVLTFLEETEVEVDPQRGARHNDPNKAAVSRAFQRGEDLATLLSAEIKTLFWGFKGYPDPREET